MAASWANMKQEAQSISNIAENLYQDMYANARRVDLATLMNDRQYHDHILNYDAEKSAYEPTAEDWKDAERHLNESSLSDSYPEPQDLER